MFVLFFLNWRVLKLCRTFFGLCSFSPDMLLCVLSVSLFFGISVLLCCLCVVLCLFDGVILFFAFDVLCCLLVWDFVSGICLFFVRLLAWCDYVLFCLWFYANVDCVLSLCCCCCLLRVCRLLFLVSKCCLSSFLFSACC